MNWDSWNDFLAMGGYAAYVWGSFGAVLGAICIEQWLLRGQRHAALKAVRLESLRPRGRR